MANQVSYLTRGQLDSIRTRVLDQQQDHKLEESLRLKSLSDERAAKWPNTLQAQRARKERARIERMAAEEAERVEADRAEAEIRAEHRRIQIERANKILFDETDKVKALHGKMLQSDAIKENEALVEFKKQIEVLKKAQEATFVEQQRQAMEIAEAAELAKFEAARQRALDQKAVQTQQLEELKKRILAERAENKREGEFLKQQAIQEAEEMKAKDRARIAKAKQLNAETTEANNTLKAFKLREKELERKQEEAIEAYSRKKQELTAERQRREAERVAKKEADRKAIADAMEKNFVEWKSKEESRLARDVAAAEERSAADEAARKQRIKDQLAAMDRSNKQQLRRKAEAKAAAVAEDALFVDAWQTRVKELKAEEQAEAAQRLADAKKLKAYQKRQSERKSARTAAERLADLQETAMIEAGMQEQDQVFNEYAQECIHEYRSQGKTTVPMELLLAKQKKNTFQVLV